MTAAPVPPATPTLPEFGRLHAVDTAEAALALGVAFTVQPLPTLFELHRVADVTGISGTGRIAVGVVWPLSGGACMRWSTPRPPAGYPQRVRQVELVDSIAEIMGVHGHSGATQLVLRDPGDLGATAHPPARLTGPGDRGPLDYDVPEVFAVVDPADDVEAWGVWWSHNERAVMYWPEHTYLTGRRQVERTVQYRTLSHLARDLPMPTSAGQHHVVYAGTRRGRLLAGRVREQHRDNLARAAQALDLAYRAGTITDTDARAAFATELGVDRP